MSSQKLSRHNSSSSSFNNERNLTATIIEMVTEATFSNTTINPSNITSEQMMDQEWIKILITVFSAFIMIFIIIAAIFGNLLVIISVMRVRKLR